MAGLVGSLGAAVVLLPGLAYLGVVLGGSAGRLFGRQNEYVITFDNAPGVTVGTPVRRSGVKIGAVSKVELNDETGKVIVTIAIDRRFTIRSNDMAEITNMLVPMEIPAGAALVFAGTLLHRGGANVTDKPRLAFTNQYCEPWARPQENFWLSVPKAIVRKMSPAARILLGYEIAPPFLGMVTASHPSKALEEGWAPPILTQGVKI